MACLAQLLTARRSLIRDALPGAASEILNCERLYHTVLCLVRLIAFPLRILSENRHSFPHSFQLHKTWAPPFFKQSSTVRDHGKPGESKIFENQSNRLRGSGAGPSVARGRLPTFSLVPSLIGYLLLRHRSCRIHILCDVAKCAKQSSSILPRFSLDRHGVPSRMPR